MELAASSGASTSLGYLDLLSSLSWCLKDQPHNSTSGRKLDIERSFGTRDLLVHATCDAKV